MQCIDKSVEALKIKARLVNVNPCATAADRGMYVFRRCIRINN